MLNPLDLSGRAIVVTGASSGIGRETAVLLSELGARVVLIARRENELQKTKSLLTGDGHLIKTYDLLNIDGVSGLFKTIAEETGGVSGLVHSAGLLLIQPLRFLSLEEINKVFSLNVNATIALTKAFRQKGVCLPNSSVVFLASILGMLGQAGLSVYSASKGAVIALTKSLALELARETIRVNCVAPSIVKTEMVVNSADSILTDEQIQENKTRAPLGQGLPRDVANAIAFLLADTARWITGSTLVVDGGHSVRF